MINTKKTTLRHIIIKLPKITCKKKNLKISEIKHIVVKEATRRMKANFSKETMEKHNMIKRQGQIYPRKMSKWLTGS